MPAFESTLRSLFSRHSTRFVTSLLTDSVAPPLSRDLSVLGWTRNSSTGFWIISGSEEYIGGGPTKQDLTVQVSPPLRRLKQSRICFMLQPWICHSFGLGLSDG